jgi:NAD(P)-dependent dehydrogenase (short-subunit alcohol dehydrogenase family)
MTLPLSGKVALVTGAARGLGRAYALRLAALGADIVIADIDLDAAAQFGEKLAADSVAAEIEQLGRRALAVLADLTQQADVARLFAAATERFGRIDVLVNNAGGAIARDSGPMATETSLADIRLLFDVNYLSTVLCCQAVAPIMRRQGSGTIINTSSQTGISAFANGMLAIYGSAKAAIVQYTRCLAAELGPEGIRANCISPGIILTARVAEQARARGIGTDAQAQSVALRRLGTPEDCAGVIEFLATDLSRYVTGQCISVCGGAVLTPN